MPTTGLFAIIPVKPDCETLLSDLLLANGRDVLGKRTLSGVPRINFQNCSTLHFARICLIQRPGETPRIVLVCDFDGSPRDFLNELHNATVRSDLIWNCCVGYTGQDDFAEFILSHEKKPDALYFGFKQTLSDFRRDSLARDEFLDWCATQPREKILWVWRFDALFRILKSIASFAASPFVLVRQFFAALPLALQARRRFGFRRVVTAGLAIAASLNRVPFIQLANFIFRNRFRRPQCEISGASPFVALPPANDPYPPEDAVQQNTFIMVTDVHPDLKDDVGAVLAVIAIYASIFAPPGSLIGLSRIHAARFTLIDDGQRFFFNSVYDGTWENYIDEFVIMIESGMNALWASDRDKYPKLGCHDVAGFKQFLRARQIRPLIFYSAYPDETVLNIKYDTDAKHLYRFRRLLARLSA